MTAKHGNPDDKPFGAEELQKAAADENQLMSMSPEFLMVQNRHLNNRVVLLRALVNRLQDENNELKAKPTRGVTKKSSSRKKT
jgi:hypothetical protein